MESDNILKKKLIRIAIAVVIAIILITVVLTSMLKYEVEGESNMPFELTKLMVVSTAEGIQKENSATLWDLEIVQNNDVYLSITKNQNYKEKAVIDEIVINNIRIDDNPQKGNVCFYRPSEDLNKSYEYKDEYLISDNIVYNGNKQTDMKKLEIANQGGLILFRIANRNVSSYVSNEDGEVIHDGRILTKTGVSMDDVKAKVSFDILIKVKDENSYKASMSIDIPVGDIVNEGTSSYEKTLFKDIVFKRI